MFSVEKTEYEEGDMCPIEFVRYSQDETGFTPRLDSGATCPGSTAEVILMYIGQNENPKHVKCEKNLDFHHMHNSRWQLFFHSEVFTYIGIIFPLSGAEQKALHQPQYATGNVICPVNGL